MRGCVALLSLAILSVACSMNPATGNRQLMLISESQEIEMGREAHQEIVRSMGEYPDERVQKYVTALGLELASSSERPHLPWTFTVLDDPVVNAFALPGGFIYVTRGILTHLTSEAELAGVLGHEIGHVTARHGASRMSKAQLASLGLGVGMIVTTEFRHVGELAQQGLELLFLKYSRDDERQADDLGLRYLIAGEWDASKMAEVFGVLGRVSEVSGAGRLPSWLATHPDPGKRQERIRAALASMNRDLSGAAVNRSSYMATLDGMVFGENPREGFFDGPTFLHPDLEFMVEFPPRWPTQNERHRVGAASPEGTAVALLSVVQEEDPGAAARAFAAQEGLSAGRVETGSSHGLPAAFAEFEVPRDQQQTIVGRVAFVRYGELTYRLLGFATADSWPSLEGSVSGFVTSFKPLSDPRALAVQPARLELVVPDADLELEEFARRFPSSVSLETLALINHVEPDGVVSKGQVAKRVTGGVLD